MTTSERTRSERGSATLHVIFMSALLFTALTAATLWTAVSTARHKLTAAADLTALSAAHSMIDTEEPPAAPASSSPPRPTQLIPTRPAEPCAAAARTAALNDVQLTSCEVTSTAVTVEVSLQLELPIARPTLTASARAGPV